MHAPCSLLVLDLDGTLLDARGRVSSRNVAAVAAAEAAGVPVVVASGRSWHESRAALGQLGYRRPMVAAGGSVLSDGATGRSLVRFGMSMSLVHDVVGSLLRHRHPVLLLKDAPSERDHYIVVGDLPLDPASEWWFKTFGVRYQRVTNVLDDPHPEDTVRVGVVATGSMLSAIAEEVRGDIGERALVQHWSAVTEEQATGSATHLLEIFDRQASKWSMVRALCRREGFDERRVVAIGDGLNDVELLANAAVGIAMENASKAVCAVADAFTGHHDRDGVAQAIDRLLNGGLSAPLA